MSRAVLAPATTGQRTYVLRHRGGAAQIVHAGGIVVLPALAILIAGWQVWNGSVRPSQLSLAVFLYVATMIGITVGFHRLLAHRAFQAHEAVCAILIILGSMAAQGPPIYWVSNHRRHHQFGDTVGDPHSPHCRDDRKLGRWAGFWHAHIGWTLTHELTNSAHFCKDLLRNRLVGWINRRYYIWVLLGLLIPTIAGGLMGDPMDGALNGLLWGGGVRIFFSYHLTNSINSVTHMNGYRSFNTPDRSCNNLLLSLPTMGEAWHNNHHAFPGSAIFGLSRWEIDIGGMVVCCLEALGLIKNVRRPSAKAIADSGGFATTGESGERLDEDGAA